MGTTHNHEQQGYDAFISYRRSDGTAAARKLRRHLLSFRLPQSLRASHQRKLRVFLDTAYERGAADFYDATIRPALLAARWLIIVATPDAEQRDSGDDWIAREVRDFADGPNGNNVIVVRAKGEFLDRLPADVDARFPNVQIVDLRNDSFLARLSPQVNARLSDEIVKVAAPIFGIPLADMPLLRREEERRQMTRLGAFGGFAATAIAATVAVSIFTLQRLAEAREALDQSQQVTERNISQLVRNYTDEEPLNSTSRIDVFNNCELAARLRTFGARSVAASPALICSIEEGAALAAGGSVPDGLGQIKQAIASAKGLKQKEDSSEVDWHLVVKLGYATLALLSPPDQADAQRLEYVAFQEEEAASRFAASEVAELELGKEQLAKAIRAWNSASLLLGEIADRLETLDGAAAAKMHDRALSNALKGLDAISIPASATEQSASEWFLSARLVAERALAFANQQQRLPQASAAFQLKQAIGALSGITLTDQRTLNKRNAISAILVLALSREQKASRSEKLSWIFESIELARPAAQSDELDVKEAASGLILQALSFHDELVDERRKEIIAHAQSRPAEAAKQLGELIEEVERADALRLVPEAWDDLYRMIAWRDMADYHMADGQPDKAEAARLKARDLYVKWMNSEDLASLANSHARDVEAAWEAVWTGHYARTDGFENAARGAPDEEAVRLLERLLTEDEAWDNALPQRRPWDDVYAAGVRAQLSRRYAQLGEIEKSRLQTLRACALMLPFDGTFGLETDAMNNHAKAVWDGLSQCKDATP